MPIDTAKASPEKARNYVWVLIGTDQHREHQDDTVWLLSACFVFEITDGDKNAQGLLFTLHRYDLTFSLPSFEDGQNNFTSMFVFLNCDGGSITTYNSDHVSKPTYQSTRITKLIKD